MAFGSWTLTEELFTRGDALFVPELRKMHAPEQLGTFAARWIADPRRFARQALLQYLAEPLNCYRHEPLVKRLFKIAESNKDDELMGAFVVAFDRAIRRQRKTLRRFKWQQFSSRAAADVAVRAWELEGYSQANVFEYPGGRCYASATKSEEVLRIPRDRMPRPTVDRLKKRAEILDEHRRARFERKFVLFSPATRRYLRRRAWRYFRVLGKADPMRYIRAAGVFLARYRDADVDSDFHLLDNWSLMHALFHNCPALSRSARGWAFLPEKSLTDLASAPRLESAWVLQPQTVLQLLLAANCRTVRTFAVGLLRNQCAAWFRQQPVATYLELADHSDPEIAALGFDLLEASADLASIPAQEWLRRLEGADLEKLTRLSNLLSRNLDPQRVTFSDALALTLHRSRPVAALGLTLLKTKPVSQAEVPSLLSLSQAECDSVRPEIIAWLRGKLTEFGPVQSTWLLELLDSKHADVRLEGWTWFRASTMASDTVIWHRLLETPYNDVRERVVATLTEVLGSSATETIEFLWASVLCSLQGGGRQKPGVVAQIVARIARDADSAPKLLPLLAVAVRSLRGPEFRAGLAGVVQLSETKPELMPLIQQRFVELAL